MYKRQALATASSPGQSNNVTDTSDDGDDSDGDTTSDETVTNLSLSKALDVTKTFTVTDNGDGVLGAADKINYTILVKNIGQISLSSITVTETLVSGIGTPLSLNSGIQSPSSGSLAINQTFTFTSSYTITSGDVSSGSVSNTATAFGSSPGNSNDVTDISDDGNDLDGNTLTMQQ